MKYLLATSLLLVGCSSTPVQEPVEKVNTYTIDQVQVVAETFFTEGWINGTDYITKSCNKSGYFETPDGNKYQCKLVAQTF